MSYQVLARKYRPQNFEQMIGQEAVRRALSNALSQQRLHHAYLFSGTRGVGKTTIARIFAKCLNCEQGVVHHPCGQCSNCQAIDQGCFMDLIEVDAASRTKVEDTRELLDNALYAPSQGRFKIYLIDEVHMLSNHSFNALLKTLEEPPEHVKFLLATTDPHKLPATVLSRCLQFELTALAPRLIAQQLQKVATQENIEIAATAVSLLAQAAKGSVRDALSLLDQAIAFANGAVSAADIRAMLGMVEQHYLRDLLQALLAQDADRLWQITTELAQYAPDFQQVLDDLLSLLHHLALTQAVPTAYDCEQLMGLEPQTFRREDIQLYYQIALLGRRDLPYAVDPQSGFEMTLLRMLAFQPDSPHSVSSPSPPASKSNDQDIAKKMALASAPVSTAKDNSVQRKNTVKNLPAEKAVLSAGEEQWNDILSQLKLTGLCRSLAQHCTLTQVNENGIVLMLAPAHSALLNDKQKVRLSAELDRYFAKTMRLTIDLGVAEAQETPAQQQQRQRQQRQADVQQAVRDDPQVQDLMQTFSASIAKVEVSD